MPLHRASVTVTSVAVTIAYSDSFLVPKRTFSYWKSSDTVTIGYSDTFANPQQCHCDRSYQYFSRSVRSHFQCSPWSWSSDCWPTSPSFSSYWKTRCSSCNPPTFCFSICASRTLSISSSIHGCLFSSREINQLYSGSNYPRSLGHTVPSPIFWQAHYFIPSPFCRFYYLGDFLCRVTPFMIGITQKLIRLVLLIPLGMS